MKHSCGNRVLACVLLTTCLSGHTLSAHAAEDDIVVSELSASRLEQIFGDLGYTGTGIDSDGDLYLPMLGQPVLALVGSYDGVYISLSSAWTGSSMSLEDVNDWNATMRFSRAYLDADGDPVLEAELALAGGVTLGRVKNFILTFGTLSLPEFLQQIRRGRPATGDDWLSGGPSQPAESSAGIRTSPSISTRALRDMRTRVTAH